MENNGFFKYVFLAIIQILIGIGLLLMLNKYDLRDSFKYIDSFWIKLIAYSLIIFNSAGLGILLAFFLKVL